MTINCNGKLIDLSTPKVMGILNITPDSFYDGGKYSSDIDILSQTERMLNDGATFIDIGAYSSRPNAEHISEDEELKRLNPTLELIIKKFPNCLISIDTFRSNVAKKSIEIGACMINDISGGTMDEKMYATIGELKVPYVLMHIKGTPQTMQSKNQYENIIQDLMYYFSEKINILRNHKVNDIIIDLGFGFGKSLDQNYKLLNELSHFKRFDLPILTGISRKSMLYKLLNISSDDALNATSIANTIALQNGTKILRVHDVKEALESIKIVEQLSL
ncbi:dihydropteroate synthase [Urechidicola croceus]|uniref:Dihydropteroate synthase n=1 Tax=Urechidicola croceus TaxID=1850246 RepID=A0A1D8P755_9FLAO|nr:dihydropteroate synthase [Urechidicola croceus]AOW20401.1 dihydropteroate synthase [Urechidicola croceus]